MMIEMHTQGIISDSSLVMSRHGEKCHPGNWQIRDGLICSLIETDSIDDILSFVFFNSTCFRRCPQTSSASCSSCHLFPALPSHVLLLQEYLAMVAQRGAERSVEPVALPQAAGLPRSAERQAVAELGPLEVQKTVCNQCINTAQVWNSRNYWSAMPELCLKLIWCSIVTVRYWH